MLSDGHDPLASRGGFSISIGAADGFTEGVVDGFTERVEGLSWGAVGRRRSLDKIFLMNG